MSRNLPIGQIIDLSELSVLSLYKMYITYGFLSEIASTAEYKTLRVFKEMKEGGVFTVTPT